MKTNFLPVWATSLLLSFSLLTSCKEEQEQATPAQPATGIPTDSTDVVKQGTFRGIPITYQQINGHAVLEGDMLLSAEDLAPLTDGQGSPNGRTRGAGLANKDYRWQNWTIPYVIGPSLNNTTIQNAINHWVAATPLQFVPHTNEQDYIMFVKSSDRNCSYVGRQGGMQVIYLSNTATGGSVVRQIGHAVGLFHEHSRRDRDAYINIHWDNILPDKREQYNRWPLGQGFDYGPFDYGSIMLFGPYDHSQNGKATITRKDGLGYGKGNSLSKRDIGTVISMYSNLYLVRQGELFSVNPRNGSSVSLGQRWDGAGKTLAESDQHIWGLQAGGLWSTFRFNGSLPTGGYR